MGFRMPFFADLPNSCEFHSCVSRSCHCGSGTRNSHAGEGNTLYWAVACACFFGTSQLSTSKNVKWISGFVLIRSHVVPRSAVLCHESHVQSQLESFWSMFWYDLVLEKCCSWGDWCRSPQWLKCSQLLCGTPTTTRSKPRSRHWNLIHGSLRTRRSDISIMHCNSRRNLYKSY